MISSQLSRQTWQQLTAKYRRWASGVVRCSEIDDLLQTLALRLLQRQRRFNPSRGSRSTYLDMQFHSVLIDHHRQQRTLKRGYGRTVPLLDSPTIEHPWSQIDLAIDLAAAIGRLSACQRQLIRNLQSDTVAGVARGRGVSRDRIREEVKKLRRELNSLRMK